LSKRLFGYKFVVWCSIAIAVISFLVWGHHMFVAGTSLYSALVFSILSYVVAVPSAIKVFNWIGTMHKGFIRFDAPMLYAIGFIGLFTTGGLTGLFVAALAADVHLPDAAPALQIPPLFPLGPNSIQIFAYRRLETIFARRGKAQLAEDGTLAAASPRRLR
jgi:Cytochrome C and Quinol oxidase polypeptide I